MGTSNENARRWWSGGEDEGVALGYGGRVTVGGMEAEWGTVTGLPPVQNDDVCLLL